MRFKLLIILIISTLSLYPQIPNIPTPKLCAVSVDKTLNKPVLYWTVSDTNNIDGYIIKRVIYNGTGVLDGTLNNIAVINSKSTFSYIDTSTAYNTQADPNIRAETYVVTAFKTIDTITYYSGFSNYLSTIYLSANFDSCKSLLTLTWNHSKYSDTFYIYQNNQLITKTTDTFITLNPTNYTLTSFFVSTQALCNNLTLNSNILNINLNYNQTPKQLSITQIDSRQNNITLYLNIDLPQLPPTVYLSRNYSTLTSFNHSYSDYYIDNSADVNANYAYQLIAISSCNDTIKRSKIAKNLILKLKNSNQNRLTLQWNKLNNSNYELYAYLTQGQEILLTNTSDTTITIDLNILPSEIQEVKLYLKSENQDFTAYSNTIDYKMEPIIIAPNTILPLSTNPEDQKFKFAIKYGKFLELKIFDRNGHLIYYTNNETQWWDGRNLKGNLVNIGTYIYQIKIEVAGKNVIKQGFVVVIY